MNFDLNIGWSDIAPYLLDAVAVILFGLMVFIGYKRGFFKTIMHLVSLAVALVAAALLCNPAAQLLYNGLLKSHLSDTVTNALTKTGETLTSSVNSLLSSLPGILQHALSIDGITSSADVLARAGVSTEATAAEASGAVLDHVVEPLTVTLLSGACFIVIFILCLIAMLLITRAVDLATKLPGIKQINGVLGLLVGAGEGIVLVWVLSRLLAWVVTTGATSGWLTPDMVDRTFIVHCFATGQFGYIFH